MKEKLFNLSLRLEQFINKYGFWIGLLITLSLLWPLLAAPYFTHHDDVQIIRLFEMNKCFLDGQIPCRWVPDLGGLYGYPLFNYYAPLPYYFGELIYLVSHSFIFSVKIMFAVGFVGSYLFMYLLGRKLWGSLGGLLSGVFYSLAPYHAVVFYVRGAMDELWAIMFFPLILWALIRLRNETRLLNMMLLGISLGGLMLAHNLSSMIFIPLVLILAAIFIYKDKNFKLFKLVILSGILGLLLSAFYWIPMFFEKELVHVESTTWGYFSYTEHFKGIKKLFLERSWGWGASVREVPGGERDGMSFQIGWIHILGLIFSTILLKKSWKILGDKKVIMVFSLAMVLVSVFMIHPRSVFVWKLIEPFRFIQFPWRLLMLIALFISLSVGSIPVFLNKKIVGLVVSILILLVIIFNVSYFRPERFIQTTEQDILSGPNWEKQIKRSIFDFLPIYTELPPRDLAQDKYQILTGESEVFNYKQGTNWISFNTHTNTHTIIRLSQYYFPNWQVKIDGEEVDIDYQNSTGLITFILGVGDHQIEARLQDTILRCISNILSLTGFVFMALLLLTQIPFAKKWLLYYLRFFSK